ncbi:MAG: peptidylprolyl isomerase [Gemmatimonadetes bacterium]|nr:peptidylprolyl isomerase [Gemmatimonadota bacterium]
MTIRLRLFAILFVAVASASAQDLTKPDAAKVAAVGPDSFNVTFTTTKGEFVVRVRRVWSPKAADRLYYLFNAKYYDGVVFYRVVPGFMAQFGFNGDPKVSAAWFSRTIPDEPVRVSNSRGTMSFAARGPNTRTTQLFINFAANAQLDGMKFAPVATVISGMSVVDLLYKGYGEAPDQGMISKSGNAYLKKAFPKLDAILTARVSQEWKK